MDTEQLREELARTIERLTDDLAATPEETADALLASPAIAELQAQAWDLGFRTGRHTRRSF